MKNSAHYQKGHIYIQISSYYTATVRNAEDFKTLLKNESDTSIMEIKEVSNVSKEFESEIRGIVNLHKNPKPITK